MMTTQFSNSNGDPADTIAFSDVTIDVPILEYCAIGLAVVNSSDDVKAIADFVA